MPLKVAVFDTHQYDQEALESENKSFRHQLSFFEERLRPETALLARGCEVVCAFVNDHLDRDTLEILQKQSVGLIAMRCAGFNNVDLEAAKKFGLSVVRVPEYSPYAVAEHALAMILALNRKIPRAYNRVREGNFSLEGLVGFDLHDKTVGIIGTGKIGAVFARIMHGIGCRLLAYDVKQSETLTKELGVKYVQLLELYSQSDIISLHAPLTPETKYIINTKTLAQMKRGVFLINTSRGALIDSQALLEGLKSRHIGAAGLDVYEEEEGIFFKDLSGQILQDDVLARLLTFPNVLITSHQAFLTQEALSNIARTTLESIQCFEEKKPLKNQISK